MIHINLYAKCRCLVNGITFYGLCWCCKNGGTSIVKLPITGKGKKMLSGQCHSFIANNNKQTYKMVFTKSDQCTEIFHPCNIYIDVESHDTICTTCIVYDIEGRKKCQQMF